MIALNETLREKDLGATAEILNQGRLAVHPAVDKISLEGSRDLQGGFREDSDLDLNLILKADVPVREAVCRKVITHSLSRWHSEVELDLAVVFDKQGCGLKCFTVNTHTPGLCDKGIDCVGIYKIQKGFSGFIENMGLDIKLMYPCLIIWEQTPHVPGKF